MKNKNKIHEEQMGSIGGDTSSTTSSTAGLKKMGKSPEGSLIVNRAAIKQDQHIADLIRNARGINIQVVEGEKETQKLKYLSEIIDEVTGDISKPFTISGKNYQMVRAITPDRQKVMGVCSLDDVDEMGKNIIYSIDEFEQNIAKKSLDETMPTKEPDNISDSDKKDKMPSFEGYKHFIVDSKTGKARKFKNIEELAKAQMNEDEKYMSVKEFRKYVDETLFGSGKKNVVTEVGLTGSESDEEMNIKAQKLMKMIQKRIPTAIIDTIKTNKIAQREVIASFAELIGVPRNGLSQLITGIKDLAKSTADQGTSGQPVTENRKVIKKVKVKNI